MTSEIQITCSKVWMPLKNNKAAGLYDMLDEQSRFGPANIRWVLQMMNSPTKFLIYGRSWKNVIVVFKLGKYSVLPKSYRQILLLCHTYKLFERMILNQLSPLTEEIIIDQQAGFRHGKSTTGQLLNLTQHIEDGFERGVTQEQCLLIYQPQTTA